MKLLVATPAYDEKVSVNYFSTMIGMKELFERAEPRIDSDFFLFSHAVISYSRNVFASRVLEHPDYTHLLMVDSDTGFNAGLILRMLEMDKPICTATYPKRTLDLQKLITLARSIPEDTPEARLKALHSAYEFVGEGDFILEGEGNEKTLNIDRGFAKCRAAGTGVMLVKREVLEKMRARFPELVAPTVPGGATTLTKEYFQPFNEYKLPDGHTLSEDLSFCYRWTSEMGGEIWTNIDQVFSHHGQTMHQAQFMDKLLAAAVRSEFKYD